MRASKTAVRITAELCGFRQAAVRIGYVTPALIQQPAE